MSWSSDGDSSGGEPESGEGATLTYDLSAEDLDGRFIGSTAVTTRIFSPYGAFSSGAIAYFGASPAGLGTNEAVRLDLTYVYSDPDALKRYSAGDLINSSLSWTRPVRLGGLQYDSDFSLRPDLVTVPVPSVSGSAAVPSTLDVLINGLPALTRQLPPGPFQVQQLPVVSGVNQITMTLINAQGQQSTTTVPFYGSPNMLEAGLQTYSAEFGKVRLNYGTESADYGNFAGSATWRRGISDDLTVEAHAEGTTGQALAGLGILTKLAHFGVINLAAASSDIADLAGWQFSAGFQHADRAYSFGISATTAAHDYRDLAAIYGNYVVQRQITANGGLSLGRYGSLAVVFAEIDHAGTPAPVKVFVPSASYTNLSSSQTGGTTNIANGIETFHPAQHSDVLNASYSLRLGFGTLTANAFHDFAHNQDSGVTLGFTVSFGEEGTGYAGGGSGASGNYGQLQAQRTPYAIGDWGYQVQAQEGSIQHEFANFSYKSPWAQLSGGVDHTNGQMTYRGEVQGALSALDGAVFASNTIADSFAVVDTNGIAGVEVFNENRLVGKTDSDGQLLVPDLRSFERNHIAINPTDVAMDTSIAFTSRDVRPQDHAGIVVTFPTKLSHGALIKLVDKAGHAVPVGAVATLAKTATAFPVGYAGEAYVEDLAEGDNPLIVEGANGHRCTLNLVYHAVAGDIPVIGPLTCDADLGGNPRERGLPTPLTHTPYTDLPEPGSVAPPAVSAPKAKPAIPVAHAPASARPERQPATAAGRQTQRARGAGGKARTSPSNSWPAAPIDRIVASLTAQPGPHCFGRQVLTVRDALEVDSVRRICDRRGVRRTRISPEYLLHSTIAVDLESAAALARIDTKVWRHSRRHGRSILHSGAEQWTLRCLAPPQPRKTRGKVRAIPAGDPQPDLISALGTLAAPLDPVAREAARRHIAPQDYLMSALRDTAQHDRIDVRLTPGAQCPGSHGCSGTPDAAPRAIEMTLVEAWAPGAPVSTRSSLERRDRQRLRQHLARAFHDLRGEGVFLPRRQVLDAERRILRAAAGAARAVEMIRHAGTTIAHRPIAGQTTAAKPFLQAGKVGAPTALPNIAVWIATDTGLWHCADFQDARCSAFRVHSLHGVRHEPPPAIPSRPPP